MTDEGDLQQETGSEQSPLEQKRLLQAVQDVFGRNNPYHYPDAVTPTEAAQHVAVCSRRYQQAISRWNEEEIAHAGSVDRLIDQVTRSEGVVAHTDPEKIVDAVEEVRLDMQTDAIVSLVLWQNPIADFQSYAAKRHAAHSPLQAVTKEVEQAKTIIDFPGNTQAEEHKAVSRAALSNTLFTAPGEMMEQKRHIVKDGLLRGRSAEIPGITGQSY